MSVEINRINREVIYNKAVREFEREVYNAKHSLKVLKYWSRVLHDKPLDKVWEIMENLQEINDRLDSLTNEFPLL